jgi:hypothetical protein
MSDVERAAHREAADAIVYLCGEALAIIRCIRVEG